MIPDKEKLEQNQIDMIKDVFRGILKKEEYYDIDDIESWFENEGSWHNKAIRVRITNIAHYIQDRHQQGAHLRVLNDKCDD